MSERAMGEIIPYSWYWETRVVYLRNWEVVSSWTATRIDAEDEK